LKSTLLVRPCLHISLLTIFFVPAGAALGNTPSTAIVLFDGPKGAAYIQVTGLTLNGKTELRVCDDVPKVNKQTIDFLPRIQLTGATSIERGSDGVLTLTVNGSPTCVVPSNLKFDKAPELTPATAAEQAVLQGLAVSSSIPGLNLPEFKPGVKIVFVPAPDVELAEYLRAQRAKSLTDWQEFLVRYPSSTRLPEARNAIADIHQRAAQTAFSQYQKLAGAHKEDLNALKLACTEAQAARQAATGYRPASQLIETITRELDALLESDRARLQTFQKALRDHSPGYSELAAAKQHLERLLEIRPDYAPVMNLRRQVADEEQKLEATLGNAESLLLARRFDEAVTALGQYDAFAGEMPRIDTVRNSAYQYHLSRGRELAAQPDWESAVSEFRKAVAIGPKNQEATAALSNASARLTGTRNQQAADRAALASRDYANKGDFIEAYNALAQLPEAQRALVTAQLAALGRNYVPAASRRAQSLQAAHIPIKGRADEDAVRQAYELLDRASSLSDDPAVKLKRDFLSGKISAYYIEQARRRFEKPLGSGAGIGWLYLKEAQRYDANLGVVKDQLKDLMATYAPVYQRRARLSVGIVIRDQTSRHNSVGFADQMADAIANGLDPSGIPVEIVRRPAESPSATQPNFLLVGEILEHRVVRNANLETLQSKYRAGTHEVKNPAWLQASSDYEAAKQQLAAAQRSLAEAQTQRKTKEITAAATGAVQQAQQRADELRHKLETTDQNRVEPIVQPYQYTKKTVDLSAAIELAFRLNDQGGSVVEPTVNLHKDNHKSAVVLENVKPEDTEGISNKSVEPDDTQFLTDLEIVARDALVKAVREKASGLPAKILQEARSRAQRADSDGAAEEYLLYLNATPESSSPERDEAARFLRDQFNLALPPSRQ
jgi:tetratricopeptide (TPR) repeat protein